MAQANQSFGEQAARFGLYAPLVAFAIGLFTAGNRDQPGVAIVIASVNMLLLVAGLILSIAALCLVGKYGSRGILGRAIGGLILNGLVLAAVAFLVLPPLLNGDVKTQLAGHWRMQSGPTGGARQIDIMFQSDGKFQFATIGAKSIPRHVDGTWELSRGRVITLSFNGAAEGAAKKLGLGKVSEVTAQRLVLATDNGFETYARVADGAAASTSQTLADARKGFATRLTQKLHDNEPAPVPPAGVLRLVAYPSPAGPLAAYVSPAPGDAKRHPAIIWLFGGFSNGIGETAWEEAPADNDQSASAFRRAGLVMMYPSLRGGNNNPGLRENCLGEVDDVLAAADYLAKLDFVDPNRIYLGGHSTGGTLALLTAETSNRFRAVICFGPIDEFANYGQDPIIFDPQDPRELELRSPIHWLASVGSPTFIFEGTARGNIPALNAMQRENHNSMIHFLPVTGGTHFSILAPLTSLVAKKLVEDKETVSHLSFDPHDVSRALGHPSK